MMSKHRAGRGLIGMLALALCVGAAPPTPSPAPASTRATADQSVIAPIQALDQGLLTVMKAGTATPFATRSADLAPAIESALNLPVILAAAVGPGWANFTSADKANLLAAFKQYTVATFVENFDSYDGQKITIQPGTRALPGGAQVVRTEILSADGAKKHTIDYVMRRDAAGTWKATDVLADGSISRVATLRADFSAMLSHGGAPALQASLVQKTQKLQSG